MAAKRLNCSSIPNTCQSFEYHCVRNWKGTGLNEVCAPSLFIVGRSFICFFFFYYENLTAPSALFMISMSFLLLYYLKCWERSQVRHCTELTVHNTHKQINNSVRSFIVKDKYLSKLSKLNLYRLQELARKNKS